MLSHILKQHPDVLSINEFMHAITSSRMMADGVTEKFWDANIDGKEVWKTLSSPDLLLTSIVNAGISVPEFIYPSTGRFDIANGIPRICNCLLPLLSNDPDSLYDKLAAEIPTWPKRSVADQCRALFAVLGDITERRVTIERSGGSILLIPILRQKFPEARFVFLRRDGLDCVLSMSRYFVSRLIAMYKIAAQACPWLPETASYEEISAAAPEEFSGLLSPPFDKQRFLSYPIPLSIFADFWSDLIHTGVCALQEMPRNTWTSLRYEDLVRSPRIPLIELADFIGVPAPSQWLDWACNFVNTDHVGSAGTQLDPDELASLRTACAPGSRLLSSIEPGLAT
jgi:hypothetical protein